MPGTRLRLSDLVGHQVVDESGRFLGRVHDVRMRRDGPVLQPAGERTYRVLGLVVGSGGVGRRLGYADPQLGGPWLLRAFFGARARRSRYLDWRLVSRVADGRVFARGQLGELAPVPPLGEPGGES